MKKIGLLIVIGFFTLQGHAQTKNFIDQAFLETEAEVDTLVIPDKIYLTIILNEEDSRNRASTEQLESTMHRVLTSLNIDVENNLSLLDFNSDFKKYFISKQKILKSKMYSLIVYDAVKAGKALAGLEQENIANVSVSKTEYSKSKQLLLKLKSKAILKAKLNAESMMAPLNQNIGKAIFISDLNSISNQLQGKVAGIQIRGISSVYGNQASEPIMSNFRKIKFSAKVNVKFAIE
ncbi:SIMPL domain-containing protein [Aquimarina aquimarini]|uniref:SIMPL domain-containing protein n=1 Tax=Aquimarina aquimarini TaxID=1191734 RepID=UPI001F3D37E2|nr:SIMPL domain-containing protein [Aquimarina aquimarini]